MNEAFLYVWCDKKDYKVYTGIHKGNIFDGYICSSKLMLQEYKKRPNDFIRMVIAYGSLEDIRLLERDFLKSNNAASNPIFYNQTNGGGYNTFKPGEENPSKRIEVRQKMSNAKKNTVACKDPTGKIFRVTKEEFEQRNDLVGMNKGIHTKPTKKKNTQKMGQYKRTEKHRNVLSKRFKGRIPWNKDKKGCFNEKTLDKMRQSQKQRWIT